MTLWQGRLGDGTDDSLLAYTASLPFDMRLAPYDVYASKVHVRGLARGGIISQADEATLVAALDRVGAELASQAFTFEDGDEDVHTAIERRLTEIAGDTGAKVHTARSRNDQVATDLRLYARSELCRIVELVVALEEVLEDRALSAGDAYMPGYTHLQRAQPVLVAHHLLAHGWALSRDVARLFDCLERTGVSPLGAGALGGSSLPVDPGWSAVEMGFSGVFENSMDAVSDRDFVAEALFALALLGVHLSRLGEEIVLWTSGEFGFATLDDRYATGSSMLPQKKNADVAELARGKAGRLIGHLAGFLATLKGLPLAYNRDLQEDKEPLFDAVDQTKRGLRAIAGLVATMEIDVEAMAVAASDSGATAVDLAEWLVSRGVPFRRAHSEVGSLVRKAAGEGRSLQEVVGADAGFGQEEEALLDAGASVRRRVTAGGGGVDAVAVQLGRYRELVEADRVRVGELVCSLPVKGW